jgi:PQQ-dependent catabolism-associated beta-propeller protein
VQLFFKWNTCAVVGTVLTSTGIFMSSIASTSHWNSSPITSPKVLTRASWLVIAAVVTLTPLCAQAARVYVSNEDGGSISVLDTNKAEVIATIDVGKRPRGLKLSHDGSQLYVAVSGLPKCPPSVPDEECAKLKHDLASDGIAVIDTTSLKLTKLLEAGTDPEQFDISRDNKHLYISNEDAATVSVLNVATGALEATIPVGHEPEGVRVSPDGVSVIATSESGNAIFLIDTRTLKVVKSVTVGKRPRDVAFTPDGKTAYVSGEFDASIYTTAIPFAEQAAKMLQLRKEDRPMGLVFDAARKRLYVSTGRGGTVAVVDVTGPKLVTEIQVGARPWGIGLSRDGKRLYTANGSSNDVSIIDTSTLQVVKKVPVGNSPWGLVVSR